MKLAPWLSLVIALQSGCSFLLKPFGPRRDPKVTQAIREQLKDKRFVTVVYEGVPAPKGIGRLDNVLRFQQSALLDEALVELKRQVSDRGTIQPILEAQKLPESGSFKGDDLAAIAKASGADVLIVGYYATTVREGLISSHREQKLILRAINLKTFEVINSVQSHASLEDSEWKKLTRVLFRER